MLKNLILSSQDIYKYKDINNRLFALSNPIPIDIPYILYRIVFCKRGNKHFGKNYLYI